MPPHLRHVVVYIARALNRSRIYSFFMSMKQPCGGFSMHDDGETDVRGTYTVIAVSRLLNILTPQLTDGVAAYLLRSTRAPTACVVCAWRVLGSATASVISCFF